MRLQRHVILGAWAEAIYDYALTQNSSRPAETVDEVQAASTNATYLTKQFLVASLGGANCCSCPRNVYIHSSLTFRRCLTFAICECCRWGQCRHKSWAARICLDRHPKRTKSIPGRSSQTCHPTTWPCRLGICWCKTFCPTMSSAVSVSEGPNVSLQTSLFLCVPSCAMKRTNTGNRWASMRAREAFFLSLD